MVAFAVLAAMLVGCKPEPKEQSSISIDDFKKKATIVGTLSYDEGQGFDGTNYTRLIKPAANVTVTAVLSNSDFAPNAKASGKLTYKAVTNEKGEFEITVPVTEQGVEVRVKFTDFSGQYKSIISVKDGQPVYTEEEVVFTLADKNFFLEPDDVELADGVFECEERDLPEEYKYTAEYQVVVGQPTYSKGTNEEGKPEVIRQYVEASGVDVVIEVTFDGETFKYVAATDGDGIATFNIPSNELNWKPEKVSVKANPYMTERFTYYKVEQENDTVQVAKKYTLTGYFEQANSFVDYPSFNDVEEMPAPECRVKMRFVSLDEEDEGCSNEFEDDEYGYCPWDKVEF